MRLRSAVPALLLLLLTSSLAAAPPSPGDLSALAFLTGAWSGVEDGVAAEEVWIAPAGGSMLAIHRDVSGGRTVGFEYLRIEAGSGRRHLLGEPAGKAGDALSPGRERAEPRRVREPRPRLPAPGPLLARRGRCAPGEDRGDARRQARLPAVELAPHALGFVPENPALRPGPGAARPRPIEARVLLGIFCVRARPWSRNPHARRPRTAPRGGRRRDRSGDPSVAVRPRRLDERLGASAELGHRDRPDQRRVPLARHAGRPRPVRRGPLHDLRHAQHAGALGRLGAGPGEPRGTGSLWIGTVSGLVHMHDRKFEHAHGGRHRPRAGRRALRRLATARSGSASNLGATRIAGRSVRTFTDCNGLPGPVVRSIGEDSSGTLWVGGLWGAARLDGRAVRPLDRVRRISRRRPGHPGRSRGRHVGRHGPGARPRRRAGHDAVRRGNRAHEHGRPGAAPRRRRESLARHRRRHLPVPRGPLPAPRRRRRPLERPDPLAGRRPRRQPLGRHVRRRARPRPGPAHDDVRASARGSRKTSSGRCFEDSRGNLWAGTADGVLEPPPARQGALRARSPCSAPRSWRSPRAPTARSGSERAGPASCASRARTRSDTR